MRNRLTEVAFCLENSLAQVCTSQCKNCIRNSLNSVTLVILVFDSLYERFLPGCSVFFLRALVKICLHILQFVCSCFFVLFHKPVSPYLLQIIGFSQNYRTNLLYSRNLASCWGRKKLINVGNKWRQYMF